MLAEIFLSETLTGQLLRATRNNEGCLDKNKGLSENQAMAGLNNKVHLQDWGR